MNIPSLDGLRAFSFLLVFVAHLGFDRVIPGGFGVTVFFFLSGFLITTLLRIEHAKYGAINLRHFYLRRVLRILPPFYVVLVLAYVIHAGGLHDTPLRPGAITSQILHYFNYWALIQSHIGCADGTIVYWSLAVEEHFYLLFPLGFILLQSWAPGRWSVQGAILLTLCSAILVWRLILVSGGASSDRVYYASDTRADSILWGCTLALIANPTLEPQKVAGWGWRHILLPLAIVVLLFSLVFRATWFRDTFRYSLQGLALIPIFVVAIRDPHWGPFRWLNFPIVRHVGVLSYSLYLVHLVVINAVVTIAPLSPWLLGLVTLPISLGLAQAMHRWIERPCASLRRRLTHRRAPVVPPAPGFYSVPKVEPPIGAA